MGPACVCVCLRHLGHATNLVVVNYKLHSVVSHLQLPVCMHCKWEYCTLNVYNQLPRYYSKVLLNTHTHTHKGRYQSKIANDLQLITNTEVKFSPYATAIVC